MSHGLNALAQARLGSAQNPKDFTIDTDLKATYSTLDAQAIDNFFKRQQAGRDELKGIGLAVIDAANKYEINATYIVSHAILETGWVGPGFAENEIIFSGGEPRTTIHSWLRSSLAARPA